MHAHNICKYTKQYKILNDICINLFDIHNILILYQCVIDYGHFDILSLNTATLTVTNHCA